MKDLKLVSVLFALLILFSACPKDDDPAQGTLDQSSISAKWNVSSSGEFESFEFNMSGNYIVVTKVSTGTPIVFGTYTIIDDKTIILANFGTITISKIDDNSMNFVLTPTSDPSNDINVETYKQDEMGNSSNTELLCRTWKLISINGESVEGTDEEVTVLFSQAGTYLVSYPEEGTGLAQWKWKDETETAFLYSWEEEPIWEEEDYVDIVELTTSVLKILETWGPGDEDLYVLEPLINTKVSNISPGYNVSGNTIREGFLNK